MKREQQLERRLHTLHTLGEAVSAMRSLAAHHFRLSRQTLPAAREYRQQIEWALSEIDVHQQLNLSAPPGVLLVASDLGLCGDYNLKLAQTARDELEQLKMAGELRTPPLYCVGRRSQSMLSRMGLTATRLYSAAASVDGLPGLLLQLAEELLDEFLNGRFGSLHVISARFEGAGRFVPTTTQVLPVRANGEVARLRPTSYQSRRRIVGVAVREYLYTTLYELLLDSLASEHGMRLLAAESARQWLEETAETVRRQLHQGSPDPQHW